MWVGRGGENGEGGCGWGEVSVGGEGWMWVGRGECGWGGVDVGGGSMSVLL